MRARTRHTPRSTVHPSTHLQHGVHLPAWHHQECRARSSPMDTRVVIEARPGHEPLEVVVCGRGVVPFRHLRSEEDIISACSPAARMRSRAYMTRGIGTHEP